MHAVFAGLLHISWPTQKVSSRSLSPCMCHTAYRFTKPPGIQRGRTAKLETVIASAGRTPMTWSKKSVSAVAMDALCSLMARRTTVNFPECGWSSHFRDRITSAAPSRNLQTATCALLKLEMIVIAVSQCAQTCMLQIVVTRCLERAK